ncbi:MAG: hypothetical protein JST82_03435 [Bacteroidetes bacterium]|nr:hypothetical protein [Bacteroidota bacterium]
MKPKLVFWLSFIAVTLLSWIDNQYYTEGLAHYHTPFQRQIAHIIILAMFIPVGYWGWRTNPIHWFRKAWLILYSTVTVIIGIIGLYEWKKGGLSLEFLDSVSVVRQFFCSPAPYFILYVLQRAATRTQSHS